MGIKVNEVRQHKQDTHVKQFRLSFHGKISHHITSHLQAAISSAGQLMRAPVANMMTLLMIAIAMALPMGLYLLLMNVENIGGGWQEGAQISLFLNMDVTQTQAEKLKQQLESQSDIAHVEYVTPDQGLMTFEKQTGLQNIQQSLGKNPFPALMIVQPNAHLDSALAIKVLFDQLQKLPQVELARMDLQWVKKLFVLIRLGQRGVMALAVLLALAVVLVVAHSIRAATQSRHEEIEVLKLVGATNSFICRPFLYIGSFYGVAGALLASLLVSLSLAWLNEPMMELIGLYGGAFDLTSLSFSFVLMLTIGGGLLGWFGAYFSVKRHIQRIDAIGTVAT